jgi:hypothetical protein
MYKSISGSDWDYKNNYIGDATYELASKTHFKILLDGRIQTILSIKNAYDKHYKKPIFVAM